MSAFSCVSQMEVEVNVAPGLSVTPAASLNICVRAGCTNPAVESKDWDKEYCSNECVATHCRFVSMLMVFWFKCELICLQGNPTQSVIMNVHLVRLLH